MEIKPKRDLIEKERNKHQKQKLIDILSQVENELRNK